MRLQQLVTKDSLPGLSVVLVNTKGIVYQKNFGFADIQNKIPYSINTIQNIGSVSKTLIAVAIMKAVELKYFTLETNINDILPFKVVNPNAPNGIITVRELTNHTSGIIDNPSLYPDTYKFFPGMRDFSQSAYDVLLKMGYQQKVADTSMKQFFPNYLSPNGKYYSSDNFGKGNPGTASSYSNGASALAAYLIEVKSGMTYAEFTTKYILKPLKMAHSGWKLDVRNLTNMAKPYYEGGKAFPMYSWITYPEGGLRTSTADLSKYLIGIMKGYNGDTTLLSPASFKTMFTKQFTNENPPLGIKLTHRNKGIFWNLYNDGTIGHDGDDPGVSTFLFFNPATGLGGIFFCNKYMPDKQPLIDPLLDATNTPLPAGN
jgi:CubicO group peptidase (beta-lactamase class C family)